MTIQEKVLRGDPTANYSEEDIERLRGGIIVYKSFKRFARQMAGYGYCRRCAREMWDNKKLLKRSVVDGRELRYEVWKQL